MSPRNYDDPEYKAWRAAVRKRDNHKCQMPGCNRRRKRSLQVHHIQKWSSAPLLRYDIDNGITLCWDCHGEVNKHEHLYIALFMEIVRRNKK